jgi:hypothetical protein
MAPGLLNVKVEQVRISRVPISFSNPAIHLGDNLKWDSTNHVALSVVAADAASATAAGNYLGVSLDEQPINSLNQNLPFPQINVCIKGLVQFTVDDNSTYYPGDVVTFGAGPQLIRHTGASGGFGIGYVATEQDGFGFTVTSGAVTGIVAVAGVTKLNIWITPQFKSLSSF